jgi:hypothetical protein
MFQPEVMMSLVWLPIKLESPTKLTLDPAKKPHSQALHFLEPPKRINPTFKYFDDCFAFVTLFLCELYTQIGDLVFAKLLIASIDMEPELVCVNSLGENVGLGVLSTSGFLFTVPLHHIRK